MMAAHFQPSRPADISPWSAAKSEGDRSYLVAAMRAAVIAAVLLGILALIVLF